MNEDTRALRYRGRHALRWVTSVPRCFDCGRQSVMPGGIVGIRRTQAGVVGFAGLATCGRVWLCPVCNAKIMARRALEIGVALLWAEQQKLNLIWGSLTCRHDAQSDLAQLLDVQRAAWRSVVSSKVWRRSSATVTVDHEHVEACGRDCNRQRDVRDTRRAGRVGYIRAAELNIGPNGWHPHFHPLIMYRGTQGAAQRLADRTVENWVHGVTAAGGDALNNQAQQLRVVPAVRLVKELTGYVTKATYDRSLLSLELVWSQGKRGHGRPLETVAHWAILADIARGLESDELTQDLGNAAARWTQLEEATLGHRAITWSRGLRDFAGIGAEVEDETIAAEEVGTDLDTVCILTAAGWARVRDLPELAATLLHTLEHGGWAGLRVVLELHGIEYSTVGDAADVGSWVNREMYERGRADEFAEFERRARERATC